MKKSFLHRDQALSYLVGNPEKVLSHEVALFYSGTNVLCVLPQPPVAMFASVKHCCTTYTH